MCPPLAPLNCMKQERSGFDPPAPGLADVPLEDCILLPCVDLQDVFAVCSREVHVQVRGVPQHLHSLYHPCKFYLAPKVGGLGNNPSRPWLELPEGYGVQRDWICVLLYVLFFHGRGSPQGAPAPAIPCPSGSGPPQDSQSSRHSLCFGFWRHDRSRAAFLALRSSIFLFLNSWVL